MPKKKKYMVVLTADERETLECILQQGGLSGRGLRRARTLLLSNEGATDEAVAEELETSPSNIERTRKRFCQGRLAKALGEEPRSGRPPKLDGKGEALVIALACSPAPEGQKCWTLRQLSERVVGLEIVEELSYETVRRVLKKTRSSRGRSGRGACRVE